MGLFSKNGSKQYFSSATIITRGTYSRGGFIGDDSIHIDGTVYGDVKVNNVVIIGENGKVTGNIQAKQVISSGLCQGNILCDALELLETSQTSSNIKANKILLKGQLKGTITCGGLFVNKNAWVQADIQAKNVVAGGKLMGNIVCKQIKIGNTGMLKGKIFADRIINEGGHVEGFIGKYSELVKNNPQLRHYAHIFNSPDDQLLLGYDDYYVNVREEIEKSGQSDDESCIEADFYIEG